jgi:aminoglycoside/choline kinase family phosphotransferase
MVTDSGLSIFDFEQATIGPMEFDLAALLAQPESDIGAEAWSAMVRHYSSAVAGYGLPVGAPDQMERAVSYATLFKCLVYAGAAGNFLDKFGGEHHLQRFHYYLERCQAILNRWPPLRPLAMLLTPRFRSARSATSRLRAAARQA